jgi:hypothetical protein
MVGSGPVVFMRIARAVVVTVYGGSDVVLPLCDGSGVAMASCMVMPPGDIVIDAVMGGMHVAVPGRCASHGRAHRSAQRKHEHQQQQQQEP